MVGLALAELGVEGKFLAVRLSIRLTRRGGHHAVAGERAGDLGAGAAAADGYGAGEAAVVADGDGAHEACGCGSGGTVAGAVAHGAVAAVDGYGAHCAKSVDLTHGY